VGRGDVTTANTVVDTLASSPRSNLTAKVTMRAEDGQSHFLFHDRAIA
jgi:hypothetical protein